MLTQSCETWCAFLSVNLLYPLKHKYVCMVCMQVYGLVSRKSNQLPKWQTEQIQCCVQSLEFQMVRSAWKPAHVLRRCLGNVSTGIIRVIYIHIYKSSYKITVWTGDDSCAEAIEIDMIICMSTYGCMYVSICVYLWIDVCTSYRIVTKEFNRTRSRSMVVEG